MLRFSQTRTAPSLVPKVWGDSCSIAVKRPITFAMHANVPSGFLIAHDIQTYRYQAGKLAETGTPVLAESRDLRKFVFSSLSGLEQRGNCRDLAGLVRDPLSSYVPHLIFSPAAVLSCRGSLLVSF